MFRLKPILIFTLGFSFGAALVIFLVISSKSSSPIAGFLWLPIAGISGGFLALIFRQASSLWRGICFVVLMLGAFILYDGHRKLRAVRNPSTSEEELSRIFRSYLFYQKKNILRHLVENPALSEEVLREIESRPSLDPFLILALINSERTSCEFIKKLQQHENNMIQEAASRKAEERHCNP